ncbi:hypothetical protein EDB86DRAFT_2824503 [Lactarius hatsudake]|nr:hypothetical protein EDB86DRAFT_2824503 [Lactarius hatsudake]
MSRWGWYHGLSHSEVVVKENSCVAKDGGGSHRLMWQGSGSDNVALRHGDVGENDGDVGEYRRLVGKYPGNDRSRVKKKKRNWPNLCQRRRGMAEPVGGGSDVALKEKNQAILGQARSSGLTSVPNTVGSRNLSSLSPAIWRFLLLQSVGVGLVKWETMGVPGGKAGEGVMKWAAFCGQGDK